MFKKGRYAKFIRPILYGMDFLFIGFISYVVLSQNWIDILFILLSWTILSLFIPVYKVYRFTRVITILSLISRQITVLTLSLFFYYYSKGSLVPVENIIHFFIISFVLINIWRFIVHFLFKKYRIVTGSNYRKVIIIGYSEVALKLENFFRSAPEFGYRFMGNFTDQEYSKKKGTITDSFDFILSQQVDEVYCSIKDLTNERIKEFINFCDMNLKELKFIPDTNDLFVKNLQLDYYDLTPILSLRGLRLDDPFNKFLKRSFDIVFSVIVIVFLLSWLVPVIGLLIKLESKGPIFFKQNRPGIKEQGFGCYKFRSMRINKRSEDSAIKNDPRITKIGKFIRKTSIDELPQFFNVFFGSMSVVGPRPHLWRQNEIYGAEISRYMRRHYVKPGITGLAQTRGYRGEIQTRTDIANRIKYDIFYIENWSMILDIDIIFQTIYNIIKGEEKAY